MCAFYEYVFVCLSLGVKKWSSVLLRQRRICHSATAGTVSAVCVWSLAYVKKVELSAPAPEAHMPQRVSVPIRHTPVSATPSCSYFVSLILMRLLLRTQLYAVVYTCFSSSSVPSSSLSPVLRRVSVNVASDRVQHVGYEFRSLSLVFRVLGVVW